jgi:hypothetical protein
MEPALAFTTYKKEGTSSSRSSKAAHYSEDQQISLIRKELVALTDNHDKAIVLNQLLYWTERVKDFDLWLEEEKTFDSKNSDLPQYGWIYKTAKDLIKETLLCINRTTLRRYMTFLIQKGWVDERPNPSNKWDKTLQYRVNLRKIQSDLSALGRTLPDIYVKGFLLEEDLSNTAQVSNTHFEPSKDQNGPSNGQVIPFERRKRASDEYKPQSKNHKAPLEESKELPNVQNAPSKVQNDPSRVQNAPSNVRNCTFIYLNKDYSENTNKEHTQDGRVREVFNKNSFDKILEIWKAHIGQEIHLTEERKRRLELLLNRHFQHDLSQWEQFCARVKASPFLMGEGARKWRVTLDWVLSEGNLLKILEGNFDNPETFEQKRTEESQKAKEQEIHEVLESIEDPQWKKWCTELIFPPLLNAYVLGREPISLFELRGIANAWFDEFEGRLVWIASEDKSVLDRIQSLQFKLLSVIEREYPKASCIRTHIKARPHSVELNHQQEIFSTSLEELGQATASLNTIKNRDCTTSSPICEGEISAIPSFHSSLTLGEHPHE